MNIKSLPFEPSLEDLIQRTINKAKLVYPETRLSNLFVSKILKTLFADHTYENLNSGNVPVDFLIKFCDNILTRIVVIHCVCENDETAFNIQANKLYIRSKTASQMVKTFDEYKNWGKKTRFQCCLIVYDIIQENPKKLFPLFQTLTSLFPPQQKHHIKELIKYFIPNHRDCVHVDDDPCIFELEFNEIYSDKKSWELWATNSFRKDIVKKIVVLVEKRTETSAADKVTTRKGITRYIHTLKLVEQYVCDTMTIRPLNIDPIQWFFASCSRQMFIDAVVAIVNDYCNVQNENVRSTTSAHHGTEFVSSIMGLLKSCIPDVILTKDILLLTPKQILPLCVNRREQAPSEIRRHFHQSELTKLEEYINENASIKWKLAFTIFKEVGLRVGALSRLMGCDFIDDKGIIKDNVTVLEKMRIKRTFPVSDNMKQILDNYFEENEIVKVNPSFYIFSSDKLGRHIPHSPGYITKKFQYFCDECEIYGKHTHSHAFRHTLVNFLMANGNKIENVSRFIGHSSVATTEHYYWTDGIQNIIPQMNIPWLTNKNRIAYPADIGSDTDDCEDDFSEESDSLSTDLLVHIIMTYHSVVTDIQKQQIQEKIPNITEIFKTLCDYSIASSVGTI
jgi:site-specific recombinase XerD